MRIAFPSATSAQKKEKTEIMLNWIWQTTQHISANPLLRKFALCGLTCLDLVDEKSSVRLFGFLLFLLSRKCSTMLFTANKIESMISRQTIEKRRLSLWVCFFRANFWCMCIYRFIFYFVRFQTRHKTFIYFLEWMSSPTVRKTPYHLCGAWYVYRMNWFDFIKNQTQQCN